MLQVWAFVLSGFKLRKVSKVVWMDNTNHLILYAGDVGIFGVFQQISSFLLLFAYASSGNVKLLKYICEWKWCLVPDFPRVLKLYFKPRSDTCSLICHLSIERGTGMGILVLFSHQQSTSWSKLFEGRCGVWDQIKVIQEGKLQVGFKVPIFSVLINLVIEN